MLDFTSANNSTGENKTLFALDSYALQLQDVDPFLFKGQTFSVDLGSVEQAMELKGDNLSTTETVMGALQNPTASIHLPSDFLDSIGGCNSDLDLDQLRLSYSVFLTDILFQSQQNHSDVGSLVVATRLNCADNTSLINPIRVTFRTVEQVL